MGWAGWAVWRAGWAGFTEEATGEKRGGRDQEEEPLGGEERGRIMQSCAVRVVFKVPN